MIDSPNANAAEVDMMMRYMGGSFRWMPGGVPRLSHRPPDGQVAASGR